jgi:hypothetical protein
VVSTTASFQKHRGHSVFFYLLRRAASRALAALAVKDSACKAFKIACEFCFSYGIKFRKWRHFGFPRYFHMEDALCPIAGRISVVYSVDVLDFAVLTRRFHNGFGR